MPESSARILTWNPANWITVTLMVALMFALVGFIVKLYQQKKKPVGAMPSALPLAA